MSYFISCVSLKLFSELMNINKNVFAIAFIAYSTKKRNEKRNEIIFVFHLRRIYHRPMRSISDRYLVHLVVLVDQVHQLHHFDQHYQVVLVVLVAHWIQDFLVVHLVLDFHLVQVNLVDLNFIFNYFTVKKIHY